MLRCRFHQFTVGALLSLFVSSSAWPADCGSTPYDCSLQAIGRHDLFTAIQSLNEALRQDPKNLKALNLLGIALTESGQVNQANRRFKDALAIDENFLPARKNLAVNEFNQHRLAESAADLKLVLKDSPADPVANIYLAEVYFEQKNFSAAGPHYAK